MRTFVVAVGVLAAGTAYAQEAPLDPTQSPGFATMLRQDGTSRIGADMTYFFLDGDEDATVLRFDLHGQFVNPESGVGGYAQVPILWFGENDTSETVLGGAEIGAFYMPKLSSPGLGLVLRGGLTLPTVDDDFETAFPNLIATSLRPIDIYAQWPRSMSLRLAASPMLRSGQFFARLDAGVDFHVYHDGEGDNVDPGIIIGIGGGVDLGNAAIMGELTTLAITGDGGESLTSAAITARFDAGTVLPYVSLLIPVDEDAGDAFDAGLLLGLEAKI